MSIWSSNSWAVVVRHGQTLEIADILPTFCNDPWAVLVPDALVSGYDSAWLQRLHFIERGDPLRAFPVLIGLDQTQVSAVVCRIARYDQTE